MKKGFTLIELLAVIVILSIIALIAVPIIINIIKDTKEKAMQINAQNYMDAVELAVADGHMVEGEKVLISGTYDIIQNGKTIKLIEDENGNPILEENDQIELSVKYTGEGLKDGIVKLIDGKVRKATDVMTNENYHVLIILGEVKIFKKVNPATLTYGQNFNSKIKTLVSGVDTKYNTADTTVKSIEFLAYGILPIGYTLEEFQKLERVDVSANSDETIYAIYDGNGKVYIYAEGEIILNYSSSYMFKNFNMLEVVNFKEYINSSNVESMYSMFENCYNLTSLDVGNFKTDNVKNFVNMFFGCSSLTGLNVSNWNTSKVEDTGQMFKNCSSLIELDLSNWNTPLLSRMVNMFENCENLENLDISDFNTSHVTNLSSVFKGCNSLIKLNLSNWDTSNVTTMYQMFAYCNSLLELNITSFDTGKVTNMQEMFRDCAKLKVLNLTNFNTSKVTKMSYMFTRCYDLMELDVSSFDTSNVTSMECMFYNCGNLSTLNISSFDTSNVTNMLYMFMYTSRLKPIYIGEKWIIIEGINNYGMFTGSKTTSVEELCEPNSTESWCVVTS